MEQNETIRIHIEIDDRPIRDLNQIFRDLERTINHLSSALGNSNDAVRQTIDRFNLLEGITRTTNDIFNTLEHSLRFLSINFSNAQDGINTLFGATQNLTSATETATGVMETMDSALTVTSANTEELVAASDGLTTSLGSQVTNLIRIEDLYERKGEKTRIAANATQALTDKSKAAEAVARSSAAATKGQTAAIIAKEKATWAANAATTALKFTMKAIPWIAVASLALNVINRIVRLFQNTNAADDATQDFANTLEQLEVQLAENRREHGSTMRSIAAQGQATNNLIDQILELNETAKNCTDTQTRLRTATELLASTTDNLGLTLCETTNLLDENGLAALEAARDQNVLNTAYHEQETRLSALWKAQEDKNYALIKMNDAYEDLQQRLNDYRTELGDLIETGGTAILQCDKKIERFEYFSDILGLSRQELMDLDLSQNEYLFTVEETSMNIYELCKTLKYWQTSLTDSQERIVELEDQLVDSFENMETSIDESIQNQILSYETLSDAQRAVVDQLVDRWTMYRDHNREMFEQVNNETRLWDETIDEHGANVRVSLLEVGDTQENVMQAMIDNMRSNREATSEWSNNLDLLAERTSEEFADHMRNMGIGSAGYVAAMLSDCHDLLDELAMEFEMGGHSATNNIAGTLGEGGEELALLVGGIGSNLGTTLSKAIEEADFPGIGMALPEGVIQGIEDLTPKLLEEATEMADNLGITVKELLGINSPSKVFKGYGENIVQGLVQGLIAFQDRPINRLQSISRNMERVYHHSNRDYTAVGRDIMTGLNQGLLNGESATMSTARRIANNIAQTMRQALQINSPSRVMREQIGRFIPEGVAAGIDKYADVAIGSVDKLASDMVKINIPSIESMIGMPSSMNFTPAGGSSTHDNRVSNHHHNYAGLFDGARIEWKGEEDIRRTMEKMARAMEDDSARMW